MISSFLRLRCISNRTHLFFSALTNAENNASIRISKEAMIKLRKKTGYSFVNCRKALVKFGEENLLDAEKYLDELAIKEGWTKAAKVGNRQTSQGQCGIVADGNLAAVVELKCETDFVAKSSPFKKLVSDLALSVLEYAKNQKLIIRLSDVTLHAKDIKTLSGKTIEETITSVIGQLGENISFTKAHLLVTNANVSIYGFSHPNNETGNVKIGQFVSAIGISRNELQTSFSTEKLACQICQHIIGMNPTSLNDSSNAVNTSSTTENEQTNNEFDSEESNKSSSLDDELNAYDKVESTIIDENETALLKQSFMFNPTQTVGDYLNKHGCNIYDFWRFELGKFDN